VKLIVSDASPLIVIARSGLIPVLNGMVEEVIVPEAVYAECTVDLTLPGAQAVRIAVEAGNVQVRPELTRPGDDPSEEWSWLGAGELAAIHLALGLQCPVLMDERLGRQAARSRGLTVIGSAGLLLGAKQRGLIPAVAPILDQWRQSGYFLSEAVVKAVLERAGEA
jgi:predicted nucleic acid-binding protein